ncbi:MAG TPA: hypothetical protein VHE33_07530 [Acidobacteriaceae bacterium]|nr:hypothetical protein [Acidobacteriaceae bacterium]
MVCGAALAFGALVTGCQSPWIACTVVNHQSAPVFLVEVNYPGGSFGVQTIAPGGTFRYRFHSLSTDMVSVDFTDAAHKSHTVKGPRLLQRQEGTLQIEIEPDNKVSWTPVLKNAP